MRSHLHSPGKHTRGDESGVRKECAELWDSEKKREGPGLSQRSEVRAGASSSQYRHPVQFTSEESPLFAYLLLPIHAMSGKDAPGDIS